MLATSSGGTGTTSPSGILIGTATGFQTLALGNGLTLAGTTLSTALFATAPLAYNPATGTFSIGQSSTTTDGYLSATDFNTFNNKVSSSSLLALLAPLSAFPFSPTTAFGAAANATSTLIGFNAGLYALASSTIGNGTQQGGLTINGGATTTGTLNVLGTGTSTFAGNIGVSGSVVPLADNTYSLGAPGLTFKDLYLGPHSLYVNGQQVLSTDSSNDVVVSSDVNENLVVQTAGTANIELNPSGTGQVLIKNNVNITGGKSITTSDLSALPIPNGVAAGNLTIAGHSITASDTNGGIFLTPNGSGGTYVTLGNFGIGTTSPTNKLEVNGGEYIGGNSHITGSLTLGNLNGLLTSTNGLVSTVSTSSLGLLSTSSIDSIDKSYFFSTTSASYFLSQNQGNAFSTTSANYWQTQNNFFSTSSASYFANSLGLVSSTSLSGGAGISYNPSTGVITNTIGYPFPNNATSTLISFNGGASTTDLSAGVAFFGKTATSSFSANGTLTLGNATGSIQCLHVDANGKVSGTGSDCGAGGGGGSSTFLGLSDTPNAYIAGQVFYTNATADAVTSSNSFTFDGTTLIAPGLSANTLTVSGSSSFGTVIAGVWHGTTIAPAYGGTGTSTLPGYGQILIGNGNNGYALVGTSSLGLFSSTSIQAQAPLSWNPLSGALSIAQSGPSADGYLAQTDWNSFNARLSTSSLGLVDKGYFFSTTSAIYFASASTSIAKTYSNNTFTGSNTFSGATIANGGLTVGSLTGLLYGTNGSVGTIATNSLGLLGSSSLSALAPLSYNAGNGQFSISQSSTTTNGYLSSADFNTFNNKISSTSLSATGPLSYSPSTGVFTIAQSGPATDGYLSQGDWNSFNNRLSTSSLGLFDKGYFFSTTSATYFLSQNQNLAFATSSADYWKTQNNFFSTSSALYFSQQGLAFSTSSASYFLSQNQGNAFSTTSAINFVNSSTTIPKTYSANTFTNGNTFSGSLAANGGLTVGSLTGLLYGTGGSVGTVATNTLGLLGSTSISALGPLSYNVATGVFSISQSSTTTNGYLSSADFNTFNNKISSTSLSAAGPLSYNPVSGQFVIAQSGPATDGYLGQGDWNSFNGRLSTSTLGLFDNGLLLLDLFGLVLLAARSCLLNYFIKLLADTADTLRLLDHLGKLLVVARPRLLHTLPAIYFASASTSIAKTYSQQHFHGQQHVQRRDYCQRRAHRRLAHRAPAGGGGSRLGKLDAFGSLRRHTGTSSGAGLRARCSSAKATAVISLSPPRRSASPASGRSLPRLRSCTIPAPGPSRSRMPRPTARRSARRHSRRATSTTTARALSASITQTGQKAAVGQPGFLSGSDFSIFENKISSSSLSGASVISYTGSSGVITTQAGTFGGNSSSVYTFPGDVITTGTATTTNLYVNGAVTGAGLSACSGDH